MPPDTTQTIVSPSLCLERGKRYKIKFTFDQYDPNTPKATINIDAVMLACIQFRVAVKIKLITNYYSIISYLYLDRDSYQTEMKESHISTHG